MAARYREDLAPIGHNLSDSGPCISKNFSGSSHRRTESVIWQLHIESKVLLEERYRELSGQRDIEAQKRTSEQPRL